VRGEREQQASGRADPLDLGDELAAGHVLPAPGPLRRRLLVPPGRGVVLELRHQARRRVHVAPGKPALDELGEELAGARRDAFVGEARLLAIQAPFRTAPIVGAVAAERFANRRNVRTSTNSLFCSRSIERFPSVADGGAPSSAS
jgi:hypothetical protein